MIRCWQSDEGSIEVTRCDQFIDGTESWQVSVAFFQTGRPVIEARNKGRNFKFVVEFGKQLPPPRPVRIVDAKERDAKRAGHV